jgi:4-carboxymuconolactone decarboxylase
MSPARSNPDLQGLLPYFHEWVNEKLFGEVWERPQLSKRDRSLITIAILTSHYYDMNLADHVVRGLDNGLTPDEIYEVITHTAFYSGAPVAFQMARIARDTIEGYEGNDTSD